MRALSWSASYNVSLLLNQAVGSHPQGPIPRIFGKTSMSSCRHRPIDLARMS